MTAPNTGQCTACSGTICHRNRGPRYSSAAWQQRGVTASEHNQELSNFFLFGFGAGARPKATESTVRSLDSYSHAANHSSAATAAAAAEAESAATACATKARAPASKTRNQNQKSVTFFCGFMLLQKQRLSHASTPRSLDSYSRSLSMSSSSNKGMSIGCMSVSEQQHIQHNENSPGFVAALQDQRQAIVR